ncbi:MAG: acetate--CoA ligase alpha subunit [bacterium JZ-2024 1]
MNSLKPIFEPKSIAVIGASRQKGKLGCALFTNLLISGYTGVLYPINPSASSVCGVKAYPTVLDVPDEIDLAVIIIPAEYVPESLEQCGKKGVKGAIIITAGFSEMGPEGRKREELIRSIAKRYGIRLIGPNCFGVINTDKNISMNATFAKRCPSSGNIAFISQSGAIGVSALEFALARNIGISKFVSFGNKADVDENQLMEYLRDDPETRVILIYLESLANPRKFINLCREITGEISKVKPILAVKSGRTEAGARAAFSHTGALAASDEVIDSLFEQSGVIRVDSLEELFDTAKTFSLQPIPRGNRIAVVTNAGGPGIMATDTLIRMGSRLADLSPQTKEKLKQILPPTASTENPIDMIADAGENTYFNVLDTVLSEDTVDSVLTILTPHIATKPEQIALKVSEVTKKYNKPVLFCMMAIQDVAPAIAILEKNGIPVYEYPEAAAKVLSHLSRFAWWVHRPRTEFLTFPDVSRDKVYEILHRIREKNRNHLTEPEAYQVLEAYGFPIAPYRLAHNLEEAIDRAEELGYPVVIKIVSPDIVHKIDIGGVRINLQDEEELVHHYREMMRAVRNKKPEAHCEAVLVQKMIKGAKEAILGIKRSPQFGPLLAFGLGGIYVEVFKDVTFRLAPIRPLGAQRMIQGIKAYSLLEGMRGEPPSDIPALTEALLRLSQLATEIEEIEELDINPLMILPEGEGVVVADARILITLSP